MLVVLIVRYTAEDVLDRNQTAIERNQPVINGELLFVNPKKKTFEKQK